MAADEAASDPGERTIAAPASGSEEKTLVRLPGAGAPSDDGERTLVAATVKRTIDSEGVTLIDLAIDDLAIDVDGGGAVGGRVGGRAARPAASATAPSPEASTEGGPPAHAARPARDGVTVSDRLPRIPRDGKTLSDRLPRAAPPPQDGRTAKEIGGPAVPARDGRTAREGAAARPARAGTAADSSELETRSGEDIASSGASDPGAGAGSGSFEGERFHSEATVSGFGTAGTSPEDLQEQDTERGARRRLAQADALIGRIADGKYRILSLLGRGGFGAVYRALHIGMSRPVAFKTLLADLVQDESVLARFRREAQVASRFTHPHAIQVYDLSRLPDGTYYIAMELLSGESLQSRLKREGRVPVPVALNLAAQCLSALAAAHRKGVVHRDLKPDNIFLEDREGIGVYAKVIDFGIAKLGGEPGDDGDDGATGAGGFDGRKTADDLVPGGGTDAFVTKVGAFTGTPAYASPEQCEGMPVEPASDVYSFGIVLHRVLTGELPFTSDTPAGYLAQHLFEPARSLRRSRPELDIPEALDALVLKALAKEPSERFADAAAMLAAVEAVARDLGVELEGALGATGLAGQRVVTRVARPRWLAPLLAVVLALAAAVSAFAVWKARQRAAEAWPPPELAALFQAVDDEIARAGFDEAQRAIEAGYAEHEAKLDGARRAKLASWRDEAGRRIAAARAADHAGAARLLAAARERFRADPSERGASALEDSLRALAARHPRAPALREAPALVEAARLEAAEAGEARLDALAVEVREARRALGFAAAKEALARARAEIAAAFPSRLGAAEQAIEQALAAWQQEARAAHAARRADGAPHRDRAAYAAALGALGALDLAFEGTDAWAEHAALRAAWEREAAEPGPRALGDALDAEGRGASWREMLPVYEDLARRFAGEPRVLATATARLRALEAAREADARAALAAVDAGVASLAAERRYDDALALIDRFDPAPFGAAVPAEVVAERRDGLAREAASALAALLAAVDDPGSPLRRAGRPAAALAALAPFAALAAPRFAETRDAARARADALAPIAALHADMVAVPSGRARIGHDGARAWSEKPARAVDLASFRIDRVEVANADYALFVAATGHRPPQGWTGGRPPAGRERWPVTGVSRDDAEAFARWAWKRLPTEVEWEAAARAGAPSPDAIYPWGAAWSIDREPWRALIEASWKRDRRFAGEPPRPVAVDGIDFRNEHALGLLHVIGNVDEWTADAFAPYPGATAPPGAPGVGAHGVARGGGWKSLLAEQATVTARRALPPTDRRDDVGFRCVAAGGEG